MKKKLHIDNYESFYLDFLEGNLGEDETLLLFEFLSKHPELQVTDLGETLSSSTKLHLDQSFKQALKQPISVIEIDSSTIDFFLISEKENLLSKAEKNQLNEFLLLHPNYEKNRKLFALTTLIPDKTILFKDKKQLKRKRTIVLWPIVTMLAAACALVVFWLWPHQTDSSPLRFVAQKPTDTSPIKRVDSKNATTEKRIELKTKTAQYSETKYQQRNQKRNVKNGQSLKSTHSKDVGIVPIPIRENTLIALFSVNEVVVEPLKEHEVILINNQLEASQNAIYNGLTMVNRAKPITKHLADMINTEIDMKTGSNTSSQRKGFLLKLGNFEIYQNRKIKNAK